MLDSTRRVGHSRDLALPAGRTFSNQQPLAGPAPPPPASAIQSSGYLPCPWVQPTGRFGNSEDEIERGTVFSVRLRLPQPGAGGALVELRDFSNLDKAARRGAAVQPHTTGRFPTQRGRSTVATPLSCRIERRDPAQMSEEGSLACDFVFRYRGLAHTIAL
jgi:hypothetical protein